MTERDSSHRTTQKYQLSTEGKLDLMQLNRTLLIWNPMAKLNNTKSRKLSAIYSLARIDQTYCCLSGAF